ncbi:unnamed protein product [Polarella glacialis]|uniref:Uncharacterized protein n=1 Tax=Polarella glacialis TaxID=89957 RepID=A0A813GD65_POLGL|nr:unnamed protein product [Polarella glacialis]
MMNVIARWVGGNLAALLGFLVDSPILLKTAAANSYGHINGFFRLVVFTTTDGHAVRIHARDPKPDGCFEDLGHNHRAPFASIMVKGELSFDILEILEPGSNDASIPAMSPDRKCQDVVQAQLYLDKRESGQFGTILQDKGKVHTVFNEVGVVVKTGDSYTLDKDTLHRLVVPRGDSFGSLTAVFRRKKLRNVTEMLTAKPRASLEVDLKDGMDPEVLNKTIVKLCRDFQLDFTSDHPPVTQLINL